MTSADNYNDITSLTGLRGLRAKLSMYLGGTQLDENATEPKALRQALTETVSNALDEHVAGYGDTVTVYRLTDDTLVVADRGRGVPHGDKLDDMLRAFTVPHSSGKFNDDAYATAGVAGTHGVGMKAVNAASREMLVVSKRQDATAALRFSRGVLVERSTDTQTHYQSVITNRLDTIVQNWLATTATGTLVAFMPDDGPISAENREPVLESISFGQHALTTQLRTAAYLHPGVTIELHDELERNDRRWLYKHGLAERMAERDELDLADIQSINQTGIRLTDSADSKTISYDMCMSVSVNGGRIDAYVNGVQSHHGVHVNALRSGLTQAVRRCSGKSFCVDDVLSSVNVMLHVKLPSSMAQFEGQTKATLAANHIRKPLRDAIARRSSDMLIENKQFMNELIACVKSQAKRRKASEQLAEQTRRVRNAAKRPSLRLSSKLKKAQSRKPEERELYIVEGDSASNIGRDPRTQAVFPIRGKIINAIKNDLAHVLKNTEVTTLISALGAGLLDSFDPAKLKYHKVILACDSDEDGSHIKTLLAGLCFKLFPGLIETGHLYVADAPLYKATRYVRGKAEHVMVYTEAEMAATRHKLGDYTITRFKGLGEMSVDEAREALADPATRKLTQITITDTQSAEQSLEMLIGSNMAARREWVYHQLTA